MYLALILLNRHMKLLIVDDSSIMRRAIEKYLSGLSLEICGSASNGSEALELFRKHNPDVVTMDITMPQMDGLTSLEQMKKIRPEVKVIIISALSDQATGLKALKLGASAFIPKPFTETQIVEELKRVLGLKT
jgi:two-component system chemotaxis response regulator CheY